MDKRKGNILIGFTTIILGATLLVAPTEVSNEKEVIEVPKKVEVISSETSVEAQVIPKEAPKKETVVKPKEVPQPEPHVEQPPTHDRTVDMMMSYGSKHLTREKALEYYRLVEQSLAELGSDIDPIWIVAMMWQESRFNTNAQSTHGARGLLQIMPNTGKIYKVNTTQLLDPKVNIPVGVKYLVYLKSHFKGDIRLATIAYNQGMGNVARGTYKTWYYKEVKEHYDNMKNKLEVM